jgi:phage baseplate assembly protein W
MSLSTGRHLSFPFRIGPDGRSVSPASDAEHVRDELLQLLLTAPGERLFLPEFGGGLRRLVFEPATDVSNGVAKARLTSAISRHLGQRLTLENVTVVWQDAAATAEITISYRPAGSADTRVLKFQRSGS